MPVTVTITPSLMMILIIPSKSTKSLGYDKVNSVADEDRSIKGGGNCYDRKDHGQYEQPHMRFCVS